VLPRDHQGSRLARLAFCGLTLFFLLFAAVTGASRYDYDALGRLIRVIDEQGRVTEYVYDPAGNLTQRTDALGQPWTFTYDPVFNQITSTRDPLARIIHKHGEQNGRENG